MLIPRLHSRQVTTPTRQRDPPGRQQSCSSPISTPSAGWWRIGSVRNYELPHWYSAEPKCAHNDDPTSRDSLVALAIVGDGGHEL